MRPWGKVTLGVGTALLLLLSLVAVVYAHAELLGSLPAAGSVLQAPPDRVQLFFSEPIEPEFFSLQVFASDRARVDRGDARIYSTDARVLEAGLREVGSDTYTVVWRALSLDGHVVRGSFSFAIGSEAAPGRPLDVDLPNNGTPFTLEAAARWLTFLTSFILFGGFAFRPLVLDPALQDAGPAHERRGGSRAAPPLGRLSNAIENRSQAERVGVEAALLRRWLWLAWFAVALLLSVSLAALLFQASSASGLPIPEALGGRAVTKLLLASRYGGMWIARIVLLVGVIGVLASLSVATRGGRRELWWAGAALNAGALLTISASGHASAVPGWPVLAILADWAHLLAGGLWLGGLVQLSLALPPALRTAEPNQSRHLLSRAVYFFSWLAASSVAVLIVTGVYAGFLHVPSWSALLDTAYGATLSGKLLLIAPLLALAAINLFVVRRRLHQEGRTSAGSNGDSGAQKIFRFIVLGEVIILVGVLAITGTLTGLAAGNQALREGNAFKGNQHTLTYTVSLAVNLSQAGESLVEVAIGDHFGAAIADAERVRIAFASLDAATPPGEIEAQSAGGGRYRAQGQYFNTSGRWRADVTVVRGKAEETAQLNFAVSRALVESAPAFSPARIVLFSLNARTLFSVVALTGALALWVSRGRRRRRGQRVAMAVAVVLLVIGLGVGESSVADAYRRSRPNPVRPDAYSLARGQRVFQGNCATCHGQAGRGGTEAGASLAAADLPTHMAHGHADQELFDWISNGREGTAMPAFKAQLAENEVWDVINYIRTFAAQR